MKMKSEKHFQLFFAYF